MPGDWVLDDKLVVDLVRAHDLALEASITRCCHLSCLSCALRNNHLHSPFVQRSPNPKRLLHLVSRNHFVSALTFEIPLCFRSRCRLSFRVGVEELSRLLEVELGCGGCLASK